MIMAMPGGAFAQDARFEHGRAQVYIGAFITDRDTESRFDSDVGLGTEIDMENDLGLESSMTVARIGGNIWFQPRQRFDMSLFDLSRSNSRRIDETIEFGDETFTIDTVVRSDFDFQIFKIDYTFTPISRPKGYLGINAGFHTTAMKLSLSEATLGTAESEEVTAPLPVLGLRGEYAITDRVSLNGSAQFFSIDIGDASGSLRDLFLGADYTFGRRLAVGVAYNDVDMRIAVDEPGGFRGEIDWGYDGWLVYFKADFPRGD